MKEYQSKILGKLISEDGDDCWESEEISVPYFNNEKIQFVLVSFSPFEDDSLRIKSEIALENFFKKGNEKLKNETELIYKNFKNVKEFISKLNYEDCFDFEKIKKAEDVWKYIKPIYVNITTNYPEDGEVYLDVHCSCAWEVEHGLHLVFDKNAHLLDLGQIDGHLFSDAFIKQQTISNKQKKPKASSQQPKAKSQKPKARILMSGGGSGGHVFPAIAIADALKKIVPDAEFLFIGANEKIEMTAVPKAGYKIKGLPIIGLYRSLSFRTIQFPFKLVYSLIKSWFIVSKFKPDFAVGTAGYASGVALKIAQWKGIPTFLQEQNAFPGITNKLLGKDAKKVFVAFETLDKWFDKSKIVNTGNPLRGNINIEGINREEAFKHYGLSPNKKTIFLTGGSLGARTLNLAMEASLEKFKKEEVQLLWQCGKVYEEQFKKYNAKGIVVKAFIDRMDYAYALGDIIISRAGGTISELAIIGKATILVPSPNVAEDHQTKNVMALVDKNASVLVKDKDAIETLADEALALLNNEEKKKELGENIKQLAKPNAANEIAKIILGEMGF